MVYGATCVTSMIIDGNIMVSKARDNRSIVSRRRRTDHGESKAHTCDHKFGRDDKLLHIKNISGCAYCIGGVWKSHGALGDSKALGDVDFKRSVSSKPFTKITEIKSN
jgi:hypothetical protein